MIKKLRKNKHVQRFGLSNNKKALGFTLIELLLSVTLLAVSIGISSDIIITLVRTFARTQISNDVEQTVNFVFLKMQNDLKKSVGLARTSGATETLVLTQKSGTLITYTFVHPTASTPNAVFRRNGADLIDTAPVTGGVNISCPGSNCFEIVNNKPATIEINMSFSSANAPAGSIFNTTVSIQDTFVVRGSY